MRRASSSPQSGLVAKPTLAQYHASPHYYASSAHQLASTQDRLELAAHVGICNNPIPTTVAMIGGEVSEDGYGHPGKF